MNFSWFIAKRISFGSEKTNLSNAFIRVAILSTAIGIIVMILSVEILQGFKNNVKTKLSIFSGHILIVKHDLDYTYEKSPIKKNQEMINQIKSLPYVYNVQCFAIKPGLIMTKEYTQGVILKGIDKDFSWDIFKSNLVEGRPLNLTTNKISKEVIISKKLANMLNLKLGDNLKMVFLENPPLFRKYKIVGIYSTGMPEFDKNYILVDIRDVQKLNNWSDKDGQKITGYEVILKDFKDIDLAYSQLYMKYGLKFDKEGNKLEVKSLYDLFPQIFSWLSVLDINALILIVIVFVIAAVNMITALLILILDKARIIGILKSLGATNRKIQKIFVYNGIFILLRGLLYGNLIALILTFLQKYFHLIPLNPETYFISYVPIHFNIWIYILLNLGVILLTFFILFLPALIIGRISPVKVIRFN